ncbi:hypothetical protein KEJ21_07565 [Candidatus Bathyarchaeota archaeon]|nr:hypothetical protein [Candidatus Bathyarchaeota archaeon]MBS7630340.1 hypothetical protein [Candidatus Bathyarchaeota archaeon]
METETLGRFNKEMSSFNTLILINIVGAALAMGFGVAVGANAMLTMIGERNILLPQVAMTELALVGFVFAIRWLVLSAQIFDSFDDIRDEFKNRSEKADGEAVTELIVQNMAFYRDNKSTIEKLKLGSRITGAFFLLLGSIVAFNLLSMGSIALLNLLTGTSGAILCVIIGIVGVYSPSFFEQYIKIWDHRLMYSAEAEKKLDRILEGE